MIRSHGPVWHHICRHIIPSLLLNAVAPFVVYSLLSPHMTAMHALMVTALVPLGENIVTITRHRRLDIFGSLVFLSLVLSCVLVMFGGSARLILVRESLLSGAFGLLMLLSLLCPQPLVYYLTGHFIAGHLPARRKEFRRKSATPWFMSFMRLLTIVWGLVTLTDALLNTYLAFNIPIATFLAVSPLARYAMMGCAFLWTLSHARRGNYLAYLFSQIAPSGISEMA